MTDHFRPTCEPERSIYDAFQLEATKRGGRSTKEWLAAEREAVHCEAARQAARLGLRTPTMGEVTRAETYASGSADYGAKWASEVARAMRETDPARCEAVADQKTFVPYSVSGHLDPNRLWWLIWNTNPKTCQDGDGPQRWEWDAPVAGDELESKLRRMGLSESTEGWNALMNFERTYINGKWMKIAVAE